jgi:hypothetical protein
MKKKSPGLAKSGRFLRQQTALHSQLAPSTATVYFFRIGSIFFALGLLPARLLEHAQPCGDGKG